MHHMLNFLRESHVIHSVLTMVKLHVLTSIKPVKHLPRVLKYLSGHEMQAAIPEMAFARVGNLFCYFYQLPLANHVQGV